MFVLAPNGTVERFPYSVGQLRKDNPQVSFPNTISDELLASFGVYPVARTDATYDPTAQTATQEGCAYNTDTQQWETAWLVHDLTAEELAERDAQETRSVRRERDTLLWQSDWVVVRAYESGEPVPAEWLSYRQALRDITTQEGFPYSVVWPVSPNR